jgi:ABC-2 type transport system permease protein
MTYMLPKISKLRPYCRIFRTALRQEGANPKRLIIGNLASIFRITLLAFIYKVAYEFGGSNTNLPYANAIWGFGIYYAFILNLGMRDIFRVIENDVITGEVETQLIKPVDWRWAKVTELMGKRSLEFLLQLAILPFALLLLVGPPSIGFWSAGFLGAFLVFVPLAVVCAVCLFMLVGFTAFWLNDAKSVYRIVDKSVLILGGGFVPIALLPEALQAFVRFTPLGIYAAPTQLFNPNISHALVQMMISALIWGATLIFGVNYVWHKAQAKIEVNGG